MVGHPLLCQARLALLFWRTCVQDMGFTKIPYRPLTRRGLILAACFASEPLMAILHSYPFCPQSRFARLILAELGVDPSVVEEHPWERRLPFLEINPGGNLPLFIHHDGPAVPGAPIIAGDMGD